MRKSILICVALLCAAAAGAQQKWTLRQCIDHALENNIEIRQQALSVESAEVNLNTSRNSRLPNLSAGAGQNFNFGRMASYETNTYVNTQASTTSVSISANAPLFSGFRISHEIKQDELNLRAATEGLDRARENLKLAVASYYLDVLFQKEILRVYSDQVELSRRQVEMTEKLVSSGKIAESQLYDIRSQLARNETNETTAANNLSMSLLNLSQVLNLDWSPAFDIEVPDTSGAMSGNLSSLEPPDRIYQTALGIKPHIREAEYRLESSRRGIKIAQSNYWPSVSLGASFGDGYYYMFGQTNADFGSQIRNKHSESVGINLSIPIFNRFQVRNSVRQARINTANYSLQLENVKLALYKEIQQAYQGAIAALAKYESANRALEAAEEAFRAMQMRYEYGKATVYEYNEAQSKLVASRSEQLQAKYDFIFRTRILDFYRGKEIDL